MLIDTVRWVVGFVFSLDAGPVAYWSALLFFSLANAVGLWSSLRILSANARPTPTYFRALLVGAVVAQVYNAALPLTGIRPDIPLLTLVGNAALNGVLAALASGRVSLEIRLGRHRRPALEIKVMT